MEDYTNQNTVQTPPQAIPEEPIQPIQPTTPPVESPIQPVTPSVVEKPVMQEVPKPKNKVLPILITILIIIALGLLGFWLYNKYFVSQEKTIVEVTPTPVATVDPTADWKVFINTKYGYEFKYPKNWELQRGPGNLTDEELGKTNDIFVYNGDRSSDDLGLSFSIQTNQLDNRGDEKICFTLEDCISKTTTYFPKEYVESEDIFQGQKSKVMTYKLFSNNLPYQTFSHLFTIINNDYYNFGMSVSNGDFDQQKNIFDQIFSTFKFTDQTNENESLNNAAKKALVEKFGTEPTTNYGISSVKILGDWAFGYITVDAPLNENSGPSAFDFIAIKVNNDWQIKFAYTNEFNELLKTSPEGLVNPVQKDLFLQ